MTPDQHDLDENASRAHDFLHALITPLIPHDPTGIGIKVNGDNVILLSSARNMGALIGRGGVMAVALRILMKPFGWDVQVSSLARHDLFTPPIDPPPSIRDLVLGWLDARYGPEAYRLAGEPEGQRWEVYVHPKHYDDADFSALDAWSYCAARAQGDYLKVRLIAGGLVRQPA